MSLSKIEWTDRTWNPVRGCTKISPGCKHCYAETFAERFRGVEGHPYEQGFDLRLVPETLDEPLKWMKPCKIFVNSMSDLFHEGIVDEYIDEVFGVIAACPHHTFQVLTKRSSRFRPYFERSGFVRNPLNVWWGVSVEDRKYGKPRIGDLQATPVKNRFLSIEPLLEDLGALDLTGIGWVIIGGESGHGARPCQLEWIHSIIEQCDAVQVPVFVKQAGYMPADGVHQILHWGKKGEAYNQWPDWMQRREFPPSMDGAR